MLPALFFTMAIILIYPMFYIFGKEELGDLRSLLSVGFFAFFMFFIIEAIEQLRQGPDLDAEGEPEIKPRFRRSRGRRPR